MDACDVGAEGPIHWKVSPNPSDHVLLQSAYKPILKYRGYGFACNPGFTISPHRWRDRKQKITIQRKRWKRYVSTAKGCACDGETLVTEPPNPSTL
jgi:hypothetical protein